MTVTAVDGSRAIRQVTTDDYGRAEFLGLEPGKYVLKSIVSEDELMVVGSHGMEVLEISAPYDREPVHMAAVNGAVSDPTGAPIVGAVAVLERVDETHSPVGVATANQSGSISISAPSGAYILRVGSPGFATVVLPVKITSQSQSAKIRLTMALGGCLQSGNKFTFSLEH